MRAMYLALVLSTIASAGDGSGTPPRSKAADYPAQASLKTAEAGAMMLSPDLVKKIFSEEVAKAYAMVEVAIYPADGQRFEVNVYDWSLKAGKETIAAAKPENVMIPWGNPGSVPSIGNRGPTVTEDTGIIVAHGPDPMTGKPRTQVGTYEDVGVSNYPRADAPAPRKPDQTALYHRIGDRALPEGETAKPVAGYLYFPQYGRKRKNDPVALNYSRGDVSVDLKLK